MMPLLQRRLLVLTLVFFPMTSALVLQQRPLRRPSLRLFANDEPTETTSTEDEKKATPPPEKKKISPPQLDYNPDQPDIIQKFVKQRDDWWGVDGAFFASPLKTSGGKGPVQAVADAAPLPSYAYLLSSTVLSIAFIGCIFQLFYNNPPAPVLGVPATVAILITSGPAFVFLFLVAITRGQKEADDDDARYM